MCSALRAVEESKTTNKYLWIFTKCLTAVEDEEDDPTACSGSSEGHLDNNKCCSERNCPRILYISKA
ncbi:hypothetical protein CHARACLAT_012111 [Characodon lateralis]|uniref:Uncharacterized protein n=1 Tax=Characodon lateralis TaxID=208331 RepID=A0ABU7E913_9TELE|nr:hypothetical protein [Characodon lateralis]